MPLWLGFVAALFISLQVWHRHRIRQRTRHDQRQKEAVFLDCDMSAKLRELQDDLTMTEAKWREWLPYFEAADKRVKSLCPWLRLGRNSEFVRAEIGKGPTKHTSP
jgi:hypothetical protein